MTRAHARAASAVLTAFVCLATRPAALPLQPGGQAPRATPRPVPPASAPDAPRSRPLSQTHAAPEEEAPPSEGLLGVPVYPSARFLRSYDAGKGQRYYLFGSTATFVDLVAYYRSVLRSRGDLVFEAPPVYMFEVGRFDEESMAFPPGVTIKDHTWGGLGGWLDPRPGEDARRYPTVIQIVPVPPAERRQ